MDFNNVWMIQVGTHAGKLKSIRRESKKRPRLPIFPLPGSLNYHLRAFANSSVQLNAFRLKILEPYDFEAWQKIIFGKTVPYVDFEDRNDRGEELGDQATSTVEESENLEFADRILDINKLEHG